MLGQLDRSLLKDIAYCSYSNYNKIAMQCGGDHTECMCRFARLELQLRLPARQCRLVRLAVMADEGCKQCCNMQAGRRASDSY